MLLCIFMGFWVPSSCTYFFNDTFSQYSVDLNHWPFLFHVEIVENCKKLTLVAAIWQSVCSSRDMSDRDLTVIGLSSTQHDVISLWTNLCFAIFLIGLKAVPCTACSSSLTVLHVDDAFKARCTAGLWQPRSLSLLFVLRNFALTWTPFKDRGEPSGRPDNKMHIYKLP